MIDKAHEATEKKLKLLERRIKKEYYKAYESVIDQANDYFMQFAKDDQKWQIMVKDGKKTEKQYVSWREKKMITGNQWRELERRIAVEYQNANKVAYALTHNEMVDVYALNRNFIYQQLNKDIGLDISFQIYDRKAVERLLINNPDILPRPSDKAIKNMGGKRASRYHRRKLQSIATQSIVKGDSIPKIAENICKKTGQDDLNAAVRQARTMMTSAQNGGRNDSLNESVDRYKKYGFKVQKQWIATNDSRTRHTHAEIDGEIVPVKDDFSNGLEYPGDPSGDPSEVCNCRCTMIADIEGI